MPELTVEETCRSTWLPGFPVPGSGRRHLVTAATPQRIRCRDGHVGHYSRQQWHHVWDDLPSNYRTTRAGWGYRCTSPRRL